MILADDFYVLNTDEIWTHLYGFASKEYSINLQVPAIKSLQILSIQSTQIGLG